MRFLTLHHIGSNHATDKTKVKMKSSKTIDRSHVAAIVRHLNPTSISVKAPHAQADIRLKNEADARTAIDLLKARGYSAGFGATALDVVAE